MQQAINLVMFLKPEIEKVEDIVKCNKNVQIIKPIERPEFPDLDHLKRYKGRDLFLFICQCALYLDSQISSSAIDIKLNGLSIITIAGVLLRDELDNCTLQEAISFIIWLKPAIEKIEHIVKCNKSLQIIKPAQCPEFPSLEYLRRSNVNELFLIISQYALYLGSHITPATINISLCCQSIIKIAKLLLRRELS